MAKAILKLQAGGRKLIQSAATGLTPYAPVSFHIGDAANFAATENEIEARGAITFTGSANLIQYHQLDDHTTRIVLTVPEGEGPFPVGNILLFALADNGQPKPFASIVLPFQIIKKAAGVDTGTINLPNPGNRLLVNITIVHQVLDPTEAPDITVEVVAPDFANLANFDNELAIPDPAINPWKTAIVTVSAATGGPALITQRASTYWIQPFWRDLRHPFYNALTGGVHGDAYRESDKTIIWGQRYSTPNESFKAVIGGSPYTDVGAAAGQVIGGQPY